MPDFGIFRGFNEKLFGDKLYAGQLPTQLGLIGSEEVFDFAFLLNDYPNAAAAYSLRKLRLAYTGSAIRVRNSSNSEADIGFVNNVLDTASLLTHCGSGDGFVTKWYDQSGNGRDATQSTAANQPQIVSSGTLILQNGKASCRYSGSQSFDLLDRPFTNATQFSTFISCNFESIKNFEALLCQSDGSVNVNSLFEIRRNSITNNLGYLANEVNGVGFQNIGVINITNLNILSSYIGNSPSINAFINGNLDTSSSISTFSIRNNPASIGRRIDGINFTGLIQEVIIYRVDQSLNRVGIEDNINTYYSIY